ncbi:MAG: CHAD domain-containing protein, partial [Alphaproteobacteria bacterium]|nr:CHAD domain-containing protein [Alphaproteobacteria bacterium]
METEIKLKASPEDLERVLSLLEAEFVLSEPIETRHLHALYFDTPQRSLHKNGVALRVRKTPEGFIQTIKSEQKDGSLFTRGEWEMPVDGFAPDLSGQGPLSGLPSDALAPLFETKVDRSQCRVLFPDAEGSEIEIAVDRGTVSAEEAREPVSEIELELKSGSAADLFRLGEDLATRLPLQVEVETKSARGYRLAGVAEPDWFKAGKLNLPNDLSLEQGMRYSLRAVIRQWLSNQTAAFEGRDSEGVHQMRVALRRLRSGFSFFKAYIPDPPLNEFRAEAKWVASSLGPARDWDVFLEQTLALVLAEHPNDAGLEAVQQAALRKQRDGYYQARLAMTSPRYTVFLMRLGGFVEKPDLTEGLAEERVEELGHPLQELAGKLLRKRRKQVRKAGKGFAKLSADERHQLRISLKKLRYAGDFFRDLYPKEEVKAFRKPMTRLLDHLGH